MNNLIKYLTPCFFLLLGTVSAEPVKTHVELKMATDFLDNQCPAPCSFNGSPSLPDGITKNKSMQVQRKIIEEKMGHNLGEVTITYVRSKGNPPIKINVPCKVTSVNLNASYYTITLKPRPEWLPGAKPTYFPHPSERYECKIEGWQ